MFYPVPSVYRVIGGAKGTRTNYVRDISRQLIRGLGKVCASRDQSDEMFKCVLSRLLPKAIETQTAYALQEITGWKNNDGWV
jgi:hypothetical protein